MKNGALGETAQTGPFDDIPDPVASVAWPDAPPIAPAAPSPTRAARRIRLVVALVFSLAWASLAAVVFGPRGDLVAVLPRLAVFGAIAGTALFLVLRAGPRGLPPALGVTQGILVAIPLLYAIIVAALPHEPKEIPLGPSSILPCLGITFVLSLGPFLFAAAVLSRSFMSAAGWRFAAIGCVSGLVGSIGIQSHCGIDAWVHALPAHGLPIVIVAVLAAALGSKRGML